MIEVELFRADRETAFSQSGPGDPFQGWKALGRCVIVDLPSVGDQIRLAGGEVVRVKGIMHLAQTEIDGRKSEACLRLMVEAVAADEVLGPI